MVMALGALEWTFIGVVGTMSALAGLFAVYVIVQIFRNPTRRRSP
jgi:uncharacterized membrane protein YuzA (DUF378 family)